MKIQRILLLSAAICVSALAWGKPALRVPYTVTQPDGSSLTITKVGDEFCHFYLTDDNKMVVHGDGGFFFAKVGDDGRLAPSAFLASDADKRTPQQAQFLSTLSAEKLDKAIAKTRESSPIFVERQLDLAPSAAAYAAGPLREGAENPSKGIGCMAGRNFPKTGDVKGLAILVEYPDKPFTCDDESTYQYFNSLLNTPGFNDGKSIGSAWDYFNDASCGVFNPSFDVLGPVTLPYERAYYGGNDSHGNDLHPSDMLVHAVDILLEQGTDFSIYDNDNDGIVDNVFIFYAGEGEASSDVKESVWPHQYSLSMALSTAKGYKAGDVWVNTYACGSELFTVGTQRDGVGTFCHEFSHVFGLPDLYDTANNGVFTPGSYSVLDSGSYNGDGCVPPTFSAFERNALGWIDLIVIDKPMNISLPNLLSSNVGYIVLGNKPEEFFLLENRQRITGTWDRELPGHGLLIWHIEYNAQRWNKNIVNTISTRQYVDIIEASGTPNNTQLSQLKKYPFPGTGKVKSFDGFYTQAGAYLGYPLTEIDEVIGQNVTFKVAGGEAGISSAVADSKLEINGRTLSAGMPFDVFDLAGRAVAKGQKSATLPAGVYIVEIDGRSAKVAIR